MDNAVIYMALPVNIAQIHNADMKFELSPMPGWIPTASILSKFLTGVQSSQNTSFTVKIVIFGQNEKKIYKEFNPFVPM